MVKRERDPLSLFAASPSLWPSPPAWPAGRPFGSPTQTLSSLVRRSQSGRGATLLFFDTSSTPFPLLANEKGAGREDTPSCRRARSTRREAAGKRLSSLNVTGLLHCGFSGGLGFRERLVDGHRAGERGREILADVRADALEFGDRHELARPSGHRLHGRMGRVGRVDQFSVSRRTAQPSV